MEWIEVKYGSMSFLVGSYRAAPGPGMAAEEFAGFSLPKDSSRETSIPSNDSSHDTE